MAIISKKYKIGVDVGGTNIKVALVDKSGSIVPFSEIHFQKAFFFPYKSFSLCNCSFFLSISFCSASNSASIPSLTRSLIASFSFWAFNIYSCCKEIILYLITFTLRVGTAICAGSFYIKIKDADPHVSMQY